MDNTAEVIHGMMTARDALCEEGAAMVENPTAFRGNFREEFPSVPKECLILNMAQHPKTLPVA